MSDISFLFQRGWKNIWKEKTIWVFSALMIVGPLVRFILPTRLRADLLSSFLNLAFFALTFLSYAGVAYVAYSLIVGKPVTFQSTFQVATKSFWRVIASSFLLLLFVAPFICLVVIISFTPTPQVSVFAHNFFFASILLSFLTAMGYFTIAEIVIKNSGIRKSLKRAWAVFTNHFVVLAIVGLLIIVIWHLANVGIGITITLIESKFDLSALSKLNFLNPQLSLTNNFWYSLANALAQAVWLAYSTSVFVLAYVKYGDVKIDLRATP